MEKKSFLVYFDMYPHIVGLPPAQRGELLSALFEYANAEWKEAGSGEQVVHPEMTPETLMAFRFMRETIRRDTEKWRAKHQRYQDAAKRRWDEQREERSDAPLRDAAHRDLDKDPWKASDDIWKYIN